MNRMRSKLTLGTYNMVLNKYKRLLRENKKREFYCFRALVMACLFPTKDREWRPAEDFLYDLCRNNEIIDRYKYPYSDMHLFGRKIDELVKQTI